MKTKILIILNIFIVSVSFSQTSVTEESKIIYATYSADIPWWTKDGAFGDYNGEQFLNTELSTEVCPFDPTDTVFFTGFEFDIPLESEIIGITLNMYKTAGSTNELKDTLVSLWNNELIGSNFAKLNTWAADSAIYEYGSDDDLWDSNLTPEIVNSSSFGIAFQMKSVKWCKAVTIGNIELTVHIKPTVLSNQNNSITSELKIYPNPVSDEILTIESIKTVLQSYEILDINGSIIDQGDLNSNINQLHTPVAGYYLLRVNTADETITKTIIVE